MAVPYSFCFATHEMFATNVHSSLTTTAKQTPTRFFGLPDFLHGPTNIERFRELLLGLLLRLLKYVWKFTVTKTTVTPLPPYVCNARTAFLHGLINPQSHGEKDPVSNCSAAPLRLASIIPAGPLIFS